MKINYSSSISPSILKTSFKESSVRDSQFFIYKEEGYVSFDVNAVSDFDDTPTIYDVIETSRKYVVKTNTDKIIATDVVVDNTPYYFKIDYLGGVVDVKSIILNTVVDCVEEDGILYTNDVFSNLEISPGVYIYSSPVYSSKHSKVNFKAKEIELEFTKGIKQLYFKPLFKSLFQPTYISPFKVHMGNFYITVNRKIIKCVEGDVRLFNKIEYANDVGNSIQCKDLVHSVENVYHNGMYNRIYFDSFYYTRTSRNLVSYVAKQSSHVFNIKTNLYLKITEQGLVTVDKESECDFKISKKIDKSKVKIHLSGSINTPINTLHPNEYVFSNKEIPESSKVSFKESVKTSLKRFPSERCYIDFGGVTIYQHSNLNLDEVQIPVVSIDDLVTRDYEESQELYSTYVGNKIKDTTYYRVNKNMETLLLEESGTQLNTELPEQIITG